MRTIRNRLRHEAHLQQQVDAWNRAHQVGTPVIVTKDGGEQIETTTCSEAEVLGGHSAVIWLEGISGCYALERVAAIEKGACR